MPSLFGPIGDTVGRWVDSAAKAVEEIVEIVEEVASDAVETVGSALEDGADAASNTAANIQIIGSGLSAFLGWTGDVANALFAVCGAIIKGIGSITTGVIAGSMRVLGGILTLNPGHILKGLSDISSGILGAILVPLAVFVGFVQTLIIVGQGRSRRLNDFEMEIIRRIYGNSIALHNVRIIYGFAGVYSINNYRMVIGNTIYFKDSDPTTSPGLLVHEACHVWQYQHRGSRYMTDAIFAQLFVDDHYNWEEEIERGNEQWVDFNPEGQAELFQSVWHIGSVIEHGAVSDPGNGIYYRANSDSVGLVAHEHEGEDEHDGDEATVKVDHTIMANEAVRVVRTKRSYRLSQYL